MEKVTTYAPARAASWSPAARLAVGIGLATAFAGATAISAHIRIPLRFTPVPLTLQTLVVLVAGGLLGARLGALSQLEYILLGLLGLPVFTTGTILGPTGGYIIGFVFAAAIIGCCAERGSLPWLIGGAVAASLAILTCGTVWLWLFVGKSLGAAFAAGLAPFLAGDALKAGAAVAAIRLGRPPISRLLEPRDD